MPWWWALLLRPDRFSARLAACLAGLAAQHCSGCVAALHQILAEALLHALSDLTALQCLGGGPWFCSLILSLLGWLRVLLVWQPNIAQAGLLACKGSVSSCLDIYDV